MKLATALLLALATCHLPLATVAHAQSTSATINGQITDPTGKVVPGTAVSAVNIDTNITYPSKTNQTGIYVIPNLPPGRYRLVVTKDGFKQINKTDITLNVQDDLEQNFSLEVGSTSESVTVEGGGVNINTSQVSGSRFQVPGLAILALYLLWLARRRRAGKRTSSRPLMQRVWPKATTLAKGSMLYSLCSLAATLLVALFLSINSSAQSTSATVNGQITDPTGKVVPGTAVSAVNIDTNITYPSRTNDTGINTTSARAQVLGRRPQDGHRAEEAGSVVLAIIALLLAASIGRRNLFRRGQGMSSILHSKATPSNLRPRTSLRPVALALSPLLAFLFLSPLIYAQSTSATVNGQITDPTGKVVPGTAVSAVNIDTNITYPSKTNQTGIYVIPNLPPGRYRLVVTRDGFKQINKTDITLNVQDDLEQNFSLEVGSTSESITVEGGGVNINTTVPSGKWQVMGVAAFAIFAFLLAVCMRQVWPKATSLAKSDKFGQPFFKGIRPACSFVGLLALTLLVPLSALGQSTSATINGQITDPSGKVVPATAVSAVNIDTNVTRTTKTNDVGIYVIPSLPPGRYRIHVSKDGFKEINMTDLELHTQDDLQQNFSLEVGSTAESVTVESGTISDSPAVSMTVTRAFVENMPLNGRSFQDLIALAPGSVSDGGGHYSFQGQHTDANYFAVDGVANNLDASQFLLSSAGTSPLQTTLGTTQSLISVDSLQEFKIQTSGYGAEYGRQPGAQVQLTTRSGTNDPHASLFDYFRNTALDANDWFSDNFGLKKPPEHQNDLGGTFGGPLILPRLYDGKGKTFVFISYEGLLLQQPQFGSVRNVATMAFRQFAASGIQPFLNALPLPNGKDNGDQCAVSLGQTFPCTAKWASSWSNPSRVDSANIRLDHLFGQKLETFLRYSNTPSSKTVEGPQRAKMSSSSQSWTIGATPRISDTVLDEVRFNYSESKNQSASDPAALDGSVPYAKSLVMPSAYASTGGGAIFISFAGLDRINIPQYVYYRTAVGQFNLVDGISIVRGTHTLKFGLDFRRLGTNYNQGNYASTFIVTSPLSVQKGTADDAYVSAFAIAHPVDKNLSLYAQDHWAVTPRLTLDYGVRWEFNPPPGASDGVYPLALTTGDLAKAQLAPTGTAQYRTIHDHFAPRFGFAYNVDARQSRPTVVRGGFGIFYDTGQALGALGYQGFPFSSFNLLTAVSLPASATQLAPPSLNVPLVSPYPFINGISDPNLRIPYTEQWNLSLDQGLSARNTLTVSYVGNAGRKLLFTELYGNYSSSPLSINPLFTSFYFTSNASSSNYSALQVQDQGYLASGLQLITSYTWAHAIDNSSSDGSLNAPLRGNSDFDLRQTLNLAANYEIPGLHVASKFASVTRGFSWDNRFTVESGYPIDLSASSYTLPDGTQAILRPDLVSAVPLYLHNVPGVLGSWSLNPAAFAGVVGDGRTPSGTIPVDANGNPLRQGTFGRNFAHGPAFWNLNTAVQKVFPVHEKLQLLFRAEAFNVLNHPNPGNLDNYIYDSTFGQSFGISGIGVGNALYATGAPRSLQLMLKMQF